MKTVKLPEGWKQEGFYTKPPIDASQQDREDFNSFLFGKDRKSKTTGDLRQECREILLVLFDVCIEAEELYVLYRGTGYEFWRSVIKKLPHDRKLSPDQVMRLVGYYCEARQKWEGKVKRITPLTKKADKFIKIVERVKRLPAAPTFQLTLNARTAQAESPDHTHLTAASDKSTQHVPAGDAMQGSSCLTKVMDRFIDITTRPRPEPQCIALPPVFVPAIRPASSSLSEPMEVEE